MNRVIQAHGFDRGLQIVQGAADVCVLPIGDDPAGGWNQLRERSEGFDDFVKATGVAVQVIGFNVGDDSDGGVQVMEAAVKFAGFNHEWSPRSGATGAAELADGATNDK